MLRSLEHIYLGLLIIPRRRKNRAFYLFVCFLFDLEYELRCSIMFSNEIEY